MVEDAPGPGTGSEATDKSIGRVSTGLAVRGLLALTGVIIGSVWTVRIAVTGRFSPGVLFHLLPPLAFVYLATWYLQRVIRTVRQNGT